MPRGQTMMEFLLKLCGIKAVEAGHVTNTSLAFRGVNPLFVLLAAIVFFIAVWWMYRRAAVELTTGRRLLLTGLRALFLALILGLLLRPELTITFEDIVRRSVLVLMDKSASMQEIRDQRTTDDDRKRLAIAKDELDPAKGLDQRLDPKVADLTQTPRIEVAKAAIANKRINLLPRLAKNYDLWTYTFDKSISEVPAATYRQQPVARRTLLSRMPWLLPGGLALVGLALLIAGAISRERWAKYAGLLTIAAAVLWGIIATATARAENEKQIAAAPEMGNALPQLDLGWLDGIKADGKSTAIGDSLRDVLSRKGGQRIAAIVMVTDGANNSGLHPLDAAREAGGRRIPLYVYGVGTTLVKDIVVDPSVFAPPIAFAKDKLPVTVRVRSSGMAGRSASLVLKLGEERAEQTVNFGADGEQLVTVELTPKKIGEFDIQASIAPMDDEATKDNNSATQHIKVIDGRMKVLVVEQSPRWEFRYIQEILRRQGPADDRRVSLKCVLIEGDPGISAGGDRTIYLKEFPKDKKELFAYDVVILGDVDPKVFSSSQLAMLEEFISQRGGGLVSLAGKRFNPIAYKGTPLEKMLPVELPSIDGIAPVAADRPIKLALTPLGKEAPMLRLPQEAGAIKKWEDLPPIYWDARVGRAKPGAQVLVVDPDQAKATGQDKMPVIAMQQYGVGPVLYIGTDNLWRWRRNTGERYHWTLWAQLTQRMARPHLLGATKQVQLSADQRFYATNSPVTVYARLYTSGFDPVTEPTVKGSYTDAAGKPVEVALQAIPGHPGMYRGQFMAPSTAGRYAFSVEMDRNVTQDIVVQDVDPELRDVAMDKPLLEKVAATSGGMFFREEDLSTLPEKLAARTEREKRIQPAELWSSPMYFLLMLGAVTAEWVVRKMSQLK